MAALPTIAAVATIAGTVITAGASVYSAVSSYQQGQALQKEADRQARIDELHGKNELASSQREADLRRLEGKLIMSRQQAYAAASGAGAGADDPTILKIMTDTGQNAEMGARSIMYQGEARRDDYFASAESRRISGRNNFFGAIARSIGTLAGGIGRVGETADRWVPAAQYLTAGA